MKKASNQAAVQQYFDKIASGYSEKYQPSHAYHHYFFQERLSAATSGLDFEGKSILDIGAGTGVLYDFLLKNHRHFDYLGVDISAEMLHQSYIPLANQVHGEVTEIALGSKRFDYIFMLGVTTYLDQASLIRHVDLCNQKLNETGRLIVSFTHRFSLDSFFRSAIGPLVKHAIPGKGVIQQSFPTHQFSKPEAISAFLPFHTDFFHWQNQNLTPFNHLFPRYSTFLAQCLKKYLPEFLLPVFSADFLIVFKRLHETHFTS